MGKDKIVKLIADTKQYESGIEQARKSLAKFENQNLSSQAVLDGITGTLKKFVGVAALAKGAQELFTRVIAGSNDATDGYERMMRKINTSVDSFFTGIATGDFSIFENGLSNITAKAAAAADAIDKLGNADMSFSYFQSALSSDFQEQVNVMREKDSTDSEKAAAKSKSSSILADMEDIKNSYVKTADDALAKVMTESSVLSASGVSRLDLDKILRLDVSTWGETKKEELRKEYSKFLEEDKRLKKELRQTQESIPMGNGQWQTVTKKGYEEQSTAIIAARKANLESHQEAILYNETLVKKSDQWLKDLIAIAQKSDAARREYETMLKTYNKVTGNASMSMTPLSTGKSNNLTKTNKTTDFQAYKMIDFSPITITDEQLSGFKSVLKSTSDSSVTSVRAAFQAEYEDYQAKVSAVKDKYSSMPQVDASGNKIDYTPQIQADITALSSQYDIAIQYNDQLASHSDAWLTSLISILEKSNTARDVLTEINTLMQSISSQSFDDNLKIEDFKKITLSGTDLQKGMTRPADMDIDAMQGIDLNKITANMPEQTTIDDFSTAIDTMTNKSSNIDALSNAFGSLGTSLSSTGDNALASLGTILQSISVLIPALESLSAAQAVTAGTGAVAETPTLPGKIAAAATITATMISLFSTLGKLKFAEGGIVPGNNFADGITARVSSGEMILNSSQQKNLLSAINSGNFSAGNGGNSEARLQAETIIMAINNYGRRIGKGELIKL